MTGAGAAGGALEGAVAIVTGASSGIGRATARTLAGAGAAVVATARRVEPLKQLRAEVEAAGGVALGVPTDITDDTAAGALVDRAVDEYGRLDILVNCAGVAHWDNLAVIGADLQRWRRELEVNLTSLMVMTQQAAAAMRDGGDVVNISSGVDRGFAAEYPAYVTSKWGVRGFTGSAALALRTQGIRVTLVSPGEVATPMQSEEDMASMRMLDAADVAEAVLFAVTRPRHVKVSELRINPSRFGDT